MEARTLITRGSLGLQVCESRLSMGITNFTCKQEGADKAHNFLSLLKVTSFLGDTCKIAWVRAFMVYVHRCSLTRSLSAVMPPHDSFLHFVKEMFSRE